MTEIQMHSNHILRIYFERKVNLEKNKEMTVFTKKNSCGK